MRADWAELQVEDLDGDWQSVEAGPIGMMISSAEKLHIVMDYCVQVVSPAGVHRQLLDDEHFDQPRGDVPTSRWSSRRVKVRDLGSYIGRYVSFTFSDGWDDWPTYGYLHGIDWATPTNHYNYLNVSDSATLDPDADSPSDLGGVGMDLDDEVDVYVTPPSWARTYT